MLRPIRKIHQFFVDHPIKKAEILHHRYQVMDILGMGSYGIVYRCKDVQTNEYKVVKQLRPSKRKNPKEIQLFNHEKAIIRKLNHRNMPRYFEAFSEEGNYYYVMSLVKGENLDEAIFSQRKTFDEKESLQFVSKLIQLVDYLHLKDIYHLDLRIPNIIIMHEDPYLIDFGLAKQVEPSHTSSSKVNAEELRLQDYYDIGDILLYLLYTTFTSEKKKALPWTEELSLQNETIYLLKRLLRIDTPYSTIMEISGDFQAAIKANGLLNE